MVFFVLFFLVTLVVNFYKLYSMAGKNSILDIDELNEDFLKDTRLLAITAQIKKHLFCWKINGLLNLNFKLCSEKEVSVEKKNRKYFFSIYHSNEPTNPFMDYVIYHTQYDGEYLLPELKHTDFLWLIRGNAIEEDHFNFIKQGVKSINGVQLVSEIAPYQIKNKGHLMFE